MNDLFTLELPKDAGPHLAGIQQAVAGMSGVADSGELATRGLDPASIGMWVQMAGTAAGVATTLAGVLTTVFGLVKAKGIKGAKVKMNDVELVFDEISADQLDKVLARLQPPGAGA